VVDVVMAVVVDVVMALAYLMGSVLPVADELA